MRLKQIESTLTGVTEIVRDNVAIDRDHLSSQETGKCYYSNGKRIKLTSDYLTDDRKDNSSMTRQVESPDEHPITTKILNEESPVQTPYL